MLIFLLIIYATLAFCKTNKKVDMDELELGLYDLSMVNTTYFVKLSIWRI